MIGSFAPWGSDINSKAEELRSDFFLQRNKKASAKDKSTNVTSASAFDVDFRYLSLPHAGRTIRVFLNRSNIRKQNIRLSQTDIVAGNDVTISGTASVERAEFKAKVQPSRNFRVQVIVKMPWDFYLPSSAQSSSSSGAQNKNKKKTLPLAETVRLMYRTKEASIRGEVRLDDSKPTEAEIAGFYRHFVPDWNVVCAAALEVKAKQNPIVAAVAAATATTASSTTTTTTTTSSSSFVDMLPTHVHGAQFSAAVHTPDNSKGVVVQYGFGYDSKASHLRNIRASMYTAVDDSTTVFGQWHAKFQDDVNLRRHLPSNESVKAGVQMEIDDWRTVKAQLKSNGTLQLSLLAQLSDSRFVACKAVTDNAGNISTGVEFRVGDTE
eukprot:gnl/Spiro4/21723_TR10640_c0_g1_i1.p1 gnl/Spiro4/21723_TR10640_c0_g1~~gnl/Spiro4/21723_TR10640_c0_g1_i1.p1  ORF type:complete len:394 (+),score=80.58 gnl/Spiro4/21723_TR10640_c0_g1_i1:44-1183(+)